MKMQYDSEKVCKVELDTAEPENEGFVEYCQERGIEMQVIMDNGPAGGNYLVLFQGKWKDLVGMIKDFWGDESLLQYVD